MDQRISIMENVRVTSTTGEKTTTPSVFNNCWAKMEDVSGTEDEDGKIRALNVRRYTVRYWPALAAKQITDMYIDHAGQIYNIYSYAFIGRKEFITLKCSKRD